LLFIGDISKTGGAADAIEIALKSRRKLVLCGKEPENKFFKDFVEPFYNTEIDLVTDCGPSLRQKLISSAFALIKPLGRAELFDLGFMEANIQGTPVIAYDSPWVREVILDGVNGFVVSDVFGAIEAVGRLAELSRDECRRFAEETFSTDRMVRDYLNVYKRILDSRKKEDRRPWGYYQVLSDAEDHKVKRIVVYPNRRLSLQRHRRRAEHWYVVSGTARVTLDTDEIFLNSGEAINIGVGSLHRVCNPGDDPLVFIEVQIGDYFGEDDIERFEDDFGRCS
jgi:mannose-6-phosphate isomerase-like protein (cupin superfamily)